MGNSQSRQQIETLNEDESLAHLTALYSQKVLNQELSLIEFSRKKTQLESMPSKVSLKMANFTTWESMSPTLFSEIAKSVFPTAYFVDMQAFPDLYEENQAQQIIDEMKKYPLINFHLLSSFSNQNLSIWEQIARLSPMIGCYVQELSDQNNVNPRDRILNPPAKHILKRISQIMKETESGFLYLVVNLNPTSLYQMQEFVELAVEFQIPEVQLKSMPLQTNHLNELKMNQEELSEHLIEEYSKCIDTCIKHGIRFIFDDKSLIPQIGHDKVISARDYHYNYPKIPFPLDESLSSEFSSKHKWSSIDGRVLDKSKVALYKKCFKPYHHAIFDYHGEVGGCNFLLEPETHSLGSLKDKSFGEIWNGTKMQEFRQSLLSGNPLDDRCKWCLKNRMGE